MVASAERRNTTPTTSLSRLDSARAAPSGTKPSSCTAASTRSWVSGRGLLRPLSTRETDAIDTPGDVVDRQRPGQDAVVRGVHRASGRRNRSVSAYLHLNCKLLRQARPAR